MDLRKLKHRRLNHSHPNHSLRNLRTLRTVYMSTRSKQNSDQDPDSSRRTVWSPEDEKTLLTVLHEQGNFTPSTWVQAAASMAKTEKGAPKTAESCKSKWGRVSDSFLISSTCIDDSAIPRSKRPTRLSMHLQINLGFRGHLRTGLESRRNRPIV